mmetsp:Transcript_13231/g.33991  ORF Transcript_13231/g.33991 Transcript_13231/m.33991 type:complete len:230 (-) Transcript_13231:1455-2144(-)
MLRGQHVRRRLLRQRAEPRDGRRRLSERDAGGRRRQPQRAEGGHQAAGGRGGRRHAHVGSRAARVLRGGAGGQRLQGPHDVAAHEGDDDEGVGPHRVWALREGVLQGGVGQVRRAAGGAPCEPQQRPGRRLRKARRPPAAGGGGGGAGGGLQLPEPAGPGHGEQRQGHHQPARAQRRHHRRLHALRGARRRQDVEQGRRAGGRQVHDPRPLLRRHLRRGAGRLQTARPV